MHAPASRVYDSSGPDETKAVARLLARDLSSGGVVALMGPLGSGKTLFVKGLAEALGLSPGDATSPTFTIINEYGGSPPLFHVDLYRLDSPREIEELGLQEYFEGPGVVAVEWAEKAAFLLPPETVTVTFTRLGGSSRRITVSRP